MSYKVLFLFISVSLIHCNQTKPEKQVSIQQTDSVKSGSVDHSGSRPYEEVIRDIQSRKQELYTQYLASPNKNNAIHDFKEFWINSLILLYEQWKHTPWDFNGITRKPGQGAIACGYFVTTLLLDMGYPLDRIKLSTCASLTMMKTLTSKKSIENLSYLSYDDFNKKIKQSGKGVFIIGLDYHTGFLINDGKETWFLHSNYIAREGVIKEKISESAALKASGSRFVTCLTDNKEFLLQWVNSR